MSVDTPGIANIKALNIIGSKPTFDMSYAGGASTKGKSPIENGVQGGFT